MNTGGAVPVAPPATLTEARIMVGTQNWKVAMVSTKTTHRSRAQQHGTRERERKSHAASWSNGKC